MNLQEQTVDSLVIQQIFVESWLVLVNRVSKITEQQRIPHRVFYHFTILFPIFFDLFLYMIGYNFRIL